MTGKQKVVLRTAFSDTFRVGDLEITQAGTEVNASDADALVETARVNGVQLYRVEEPAAQSAAKQSDGGGS